MNHSDANCVRNSFIDEYVDIRIEYVVGPSVSNLNVIDLCMHKVLKMKKFRGSMVDVKILAISPVLDKNTIDLLTSVTRIPCGQFTGNIREEELNT